MAEVRLASREQPDTLTMVAWKEPLPGGGFGPRERRYVAVDAVEEALRDVSRNLAGAHVNADVTLANVRLRLRSLTDDPSSENHRPLEGE